MNPRIPLICLAQVLLLSCAQSVTPRAANAPLSEPEKIERLISDVAALQNATFVRKGESYDAGAAAQFMRGKWNWKSSEIHTARDFVRVCSAGGSGEGEPYYIRFTNGTQITSKEFLTGELNKLESPLATAGSSAGN